MYTVRVVRRLLLITPLLLGIASRMLSAQDWVEEPGRYQFAQTYIGADALLFPELSVIYSSPNNESAIPVSLSPRLTIGGLHFWGHADFYVSFPVFTNIFFTPPEQGMSIYSGVETGFHYYPWQLIYNSIRPFVGFSWNVLNFQQNFADGNEGAGRSFHRFLLTGGLSYHNRWGQIDLTARYAINNTFDYYVTPTQTKTYTVLPLSIALGYKFIFETTETVSDGPEDEQAIKERLIAENALSGFTLAIGPSSAFGITAFSDRRENRDFLNIPTGAVLLPEAAIGFHIYPIDSEVRLASRFFYQVEEAGFGVQQTFIRFAASLEFIKFLFDFNGFVPFLGIGAEFNYLQYQEDSPSPINLASPSFGLPIVFGWDIRPFREVNWLLRTNLRYNPLLHLSSTDIRVPFDYLEFNFIQFVYYLGR